MPETEPNPEIALRNEADGKTASFEFRGEKFAVPLEYADYPLEYIEAVGDGANLAIQARALLGPEQWATVRAMNLKGGGLDELATAIESAGGISPGNSEASST